MRFRNRIQLEGLVLMAGVVMLGCKAAPPPDATLPRFVLADVIVSVTNRSTTAMEVYAGTAERDLPLGTVPGRSTRSFSLPSDLGRPASPLHFEAHGPNSPVAVRSDTFRVAPGELVLWTLDEHAAGPVTKR